MRRLTVHLLVPAVLVISMAASPNSNSSNSKGSTATQHKTEQPRPRPYQIGKASWYGKRFHGRTTASGEPYDMFQFTAAHRQLPLGTLVKVTNLRNGESVVVRVNDRGPVPRGRVIDLSYGAATMLGLRAYGVQKVRLDLLEPQIMAERRGSE